MHVTAYATEKDTGQKKSARAPIDVYAMAKGDSMNSSDNPTKCQRCGKHPETATYRSRNGKWTQQVCGLCLDRLEIVEAYEWGILETYSLYQDAEDDVYFEKTLAWLDEVERTHRHRDHDGYLQRSLMAHRALVYWEAERYAESLEAAEIRIQLGGLEDAWDHWAAAGAKAGALEGLGRHAEALATFEEAFRHQDPKYIESACVLTRSLVKYSSNAGQPVDESWRELAQRIADHYKVEFPVRPTLAESMQALFEITHPEAKQIDDV